MNKWLWIAVIACGLQMTVNLSEAKACDHDKCPGIPDTWTQIDPGVVYPGFTYGGLTPSCAAPPPTTDSSTGTITVYDPKFTFYVKGGSCKNVLVFFEGGGACSHPVNCLYVHTYNEEVTPIEYIIGQSADPGILDTDNDANPFADWTIVYIPYCTGDLHWGANDMAYPDFKGGYGGVPQTIRHRGFVNFQVVLKWIKDNIKKPKNIFVAGSSAGSYGAILNFPFVAQAFPKAKADVLGDAGAGVTGGNFSYEILAWNIQMPRWIPEFAGGYSPAMNISQVYKAVANYYRKSSVGQFTTAWDATQTAFYYIQSNIFTPQTWQSGWPSLWCVWNSAMLGYVDFADDARNYHYYIAPGLYHTILTSPTFYSEVTNDVPFVDWVSSLMSGRHQSDVECVDCEQPIPCQ